MGGSGGDQMHILGEELGNDADLALRTDFPEGALAGHGFGHDIGLGQARIDPMGIHIDDIGDGAGAGPGRGDQARGTANARGLPAAMKSRRVADEPGHRLADGKIGSAGGPGGDDEENALRPAGLRAQAKRRKQRTSAKMPPSPNTDQPAKRRAMARN